VVRAVAPFVGLHHLFITTSIRRSEIATIVPLAAGLVQGGPENVRPP